MNIQNYVSMGRCLEIALGSQLGEASLVLVYWSGMVDDKSVHRGCGNCEQ